jgi:hypothetical protein
MLSVVAGLNCRDVRARDRKNGAMFGDPMGEFWLFTSLAFAGVAFVLFIINMKLLAI